MRVVGLITEYNPFHNGHHYHIEQAKKRTNADYIIVVMSGNFVQRGSPAIIDKYTRAQMALEHGVDLVLELPVCYATASAEYFALGAVALLHSLSIVDTICFGSECGDIQVLSFLASILYENPEPFGNLLRKEIKEGCSYPVARVNALSSYLKQYLNQISLQDWNDIMQNQFFHSCLKENLQQLFQCANNILALEYCKALLTLKSTIIPITIQRKESAYHDIILKNTISSATAIRSIIEAGDNIERVIPALPNSVFQQLREKIDRSFPIIIDDFSLLLQYQLLRETNSSIANYFDIGEGLDRRILFYKNSTLSFSEYCMLLKTKQVTYTRISRACIHLLLNIQKEHLQCFLQQGIVFYARILAFKKESSYCIREIKKKATIPLITKLADAKTELSLAGNTMLNLDIQAAHLYNQVVYTKFGTEIKNEYQHPLLIL